MTLKQVFIQNLKEFRKKEGYTQMKLAEYCKTTASYIGHIETGVKFPSMDMIEKMAEILRIQPYYFFINRNENNNSHIDAESTYPKLPKSMKREIKDEMDLSISNVIKEILNKY
jgi:transcriptional regulator with XRE-family HTH domain